MIRRSAIMLICIETHGLHRYKNHFWNLTCKDVIFLWDAKKERVRRWERRKRNRDDCERASEERKIGGRGILFDVTECWNYGLIDDTRIPIWSATLPKPKKEQSSYPAWVSRWKRNGAESYNTTVSRSTMSKTFAFCIAEGYKPIGKHNTTRVGTHRTSTDCEAEERAKIAAKPAGKITGKAGGRGTARIGEKKQNWKIPRDLPSKWEEFMEQPRWWRHVLVI